MAKGAYIGVGNVAKKIKKGYVGIGGVAKKIKKGYIGIGGVARPFWSSGELEYYGTITPLSVGRYQHAGASIGNYALFAGGNPATTSEDVTDSVEVYNTSLTRSDASRLSLGRYSLSAASIGNYALFAGGYYTEDNIGKSTSRVDAFDSSLTMTNPTELGCNAMSFASANVGNYALFGGGFDYYKGVAKDNVGAYNTSLTRTKATSLFSGVYNNAGASNSNYALFGGGYDGNKSKTYVSAYDSSLTYVRASDLQNKTDELAGASTGNYALFAGGFVENGSNDDYIATAIVNAYDASLTRTTITSLPTASYGLNGISVEGCAIFAGGHSGTNRVDGEALSDVVSYDKSLTRKIHTSLSIGKYRFASAVVGKYILFAGGWDNKINSATTTTSVDAYMIN